MVSPPRIFLDSSVLIAAAISKTGASRAIIVLGELGLVQLVVCQQVFDEVTKNLHQKAPLAVSYFEQLKTIINWEVMPDPTTKQVLICADVIALKDAPILAAAINAHPHRFITLDMHDFGHPQVQNSLNCPIQKPGQFLIDLRQAIYEGIE